MNFINNELGLLPEVKQMNKEARELKGLMNTRELVAAVKNSEYKEGNKHIIRM
jgi:hypothetical protein